MLSSISLNVFIFLGMWRPISWTTKCKITIYKIYIVICVSIYTSFVVLSILYLTIVQNLNDFILSLFYCCASFSIWVKMITIIKRRKIILDTREILANELCQPQNSHESKILNKYLHFVRISTIAFMTMTIINVASIVLTPLIRKNNVSLPMKMFVPYSLESSGAFIFTYLYQCVSLTMAALITSSVESFALMVISIICAQFEIFFYRLNSLPTKSGKNELQSGVYKCEEKLIKDYVEHHICMYLLGEKMNDLFGTMIFVQFFASLMQLCTSVYQLSRMNLKNQNFFTIFTILLTTFVQLYLYSFSGEKIMEKSSLIVDEIYHSKWTKITNRSRKDLILIMIRASRPIKLMGSSYVVMSIDTFVKIVKSAFSIYNLLLKF